MIRLLLPSARTLFCELLLLHMTFTVSRRAFLLASFLVASAGRWIHMYVVHIFEGEQRHSPISTATEIRRKHFQVSPLLGPRDPCRLRVGNLHTVHSVCWYNFFARVEQRLPVSFWWGAAACIWRHYHHIYDSMYHGFVKIHSGKIGFAMCIRSDSVATIKCLRLSVG